MGLDPTLRKAIMKEALGIDKDPVPVLEKVQDKPIEGLEDKIFEFKNQLKRVHAFERKLKLDSEEWLEEHWEQFERSLKAPISSDNSADIMKQVLENKTKNVTNEGKELHEMRVKAIAKMDFSLFEKLM